MFRPLVDGERYVWHEIAGEQIDPFVKSYNMIRIIISKLNLLLSDWGMIMLLRCSCLFW